MKVISRKNLPSDLPWSESALILLMLDHWKDAIPHWLPVVVWIAVGIVWIACGIMKLHETEVDVFEPEKQQQPEDPGSYSSQRSTY